MYLRLAAIGSMDGSLQVACQVLAANYSLANFRWRQLVRADALTEVCRCRHSTDACPLSADSRRRMRRPVARRGFRMSKEDGEWRARPLLVVAVFLFLVELPCCRRGSDVPPGPPWRIRAGRHRLRRAPLRRAVHDLPRRATATASAASTCAAASFATRSPIRISCASSRPASRDRDAGVHARRRRNRRHHRVSAQHERVRSRLGEDRRRRRAAGRCSTARAAAPPAIASAQPGSRVGARPERHRRDAQRRLAAALAPRSDQPDDADQPPGPRRDEGRHGRSTAAG